MSGIYNKTSWVDDSVPALNASNLNNIEGGIEDAARQDLSIVHNIASDANYTLTASQNQYGRIEVTDTGVLLTAGRDIIMNNNEHTFLFANSTAQTLTVKTSGGSGVAVLSGESKTLRNNTTEVIEYEASVSILETLNINNFFHAQDQRVSGTNGGSSIVGEQTRVLNTILTNTLGVTLSGNTIQNVPAGDYYIEANAPAFDVRTHQVKLRNVTDVSDILIGTSEYTESAAKITTRSFVSGKFTLATAKNLDLRHYTELVRAGVGLGAPVASADIEVYADIKIWKVG